MNINELDRLNLGIQFATIAHEGQFRKGTNIPYITHPFFVGLLLQESGCHIDVIIAGYLHDVLEDTSVTEDKILHHFGYNVLELVQGASESNRSLPWEDRKQATIHFLSEDATIDMCHIACADKLHNIRSTASMYESIGDDVWLRFNRGKEQQKWYYTSLVDVLGKRIPTFPLYDLLKKEVETLFQ